jgi:hypothetical protein
MAGSRPAATPAIVLLTLGLPLTVPEGLSSSDWASLRKAHETERYAAHSFEGGYRASNPGQRWTTVFDGCGFLTQPEGGDWTWGLELESYGFADRAHEVTERAAANMCRGHQPGRVAVYLGRKASEVVSFQGQASKSEGRGLLESTWAKSIGCRVCEIPATVSLAPDDVQNVR